MKETAKFIFALRPGQVFFFSGVALVILSLVNGLFGVEVPTERADLAFYTGLVFCMAGIFLMWYRARNSNVK